MRRVRAAPPGQHPDPGRVAVPELPSLEDADLLDLRAARPVRDLQGHPQALVPGMQEALGPLLALRHGRAGPRRHR
jgi:hypothetical protein